MTVQFDQVVFAFDFSRIETVLGTRYLWDYGPAALHAAFPGGASDPVPQLDGSLLFVSAGGPDYLGLPLRYYTYAPTQECTWLAVYRASIADSTDVLFSSFNAALGLNYGTALAGRPTVPEMRIYANQGGAGTPYERITSLPGPSDKKIVIVTVEAAPRAMKNEQLLTAPTWIGGAFGATVYDAAKVPRIGSEPLLWSGDLYIWYLAQIRGAVSSADMAMLSSQLATGIKPFCWRQT